jgi:hypothetical protein
MVIYANEDRNPYDKQGELIAYTDSNPEINNLYQQITDMGFNFFRSVSEENPHHANDELNRYLRNIIFGNFGGSGSGSGSNKQVNLTYKKNNLMKGGNIFNIFNFPIRVMTKNNKFYIIKLNTKKKIDDYNKELLLRKDIFEKNKKIDYENDIKNTIALIRNSSDESIKKPLHLINNPTIKQMPKLNLPKLNLPTFDLGLGNYKSDTSIAAASAAGGGKTKSIKKNNKIKRSKKLNKIKNSKKLNKYNKYKISKKLNKYNRSKKLKKYNRSKKLNKSKKNKKHRKNNRKTKNNKY